MTLLAQSEDTYSSEIPNMIITKGEKKELIYQPSLLDYERSRHPSYIWGVLFLAEIANVFPITKYYLESNEEIGTIKKHGKGNINKYKLGKSRIIELVTR
jgi:hypothetical protein